MTVVWPGVTVVCTISLLVTSSEYAHALVQLVSSINDFSLQVLRKALLKDRHIAFSGLVNNQCCFCSSPLMHTCSFQYNPFFNVFDCFWSNVSWVWSPSFFFEIAWLILQLDGVVFWRDSGIRFLHLKKKIIIGLCFIKKSTCLRLPDNRQSLHRFQVGVGSYQLKF
jgi:hypothetical protein